MPVLLTLPLHFDLRLRGRDRRWRRIAVGVLIALGVALLAAGYLLPARAGGESPSAALSALSVGDELTLPGPGSSPRVYEVVSLDVVFAARADLEPAPGEGVVVLVAPWPLETADARSEWRYVVTARLRF
jgi:hypothetical protein